MFRNYHSAGVIILSLICTAILLAGCTSKNQDNTANTGGEERSGRVVTPSNDWQPADAGDDTETGETAAAPDEGTNLEEDQTSGIENEGSVMIIQPSEINIELTIDGQPHDITTPYYMYEGQQAVAQFHITATGSELYKYYISSAANVQVPREGDLSGLEATIDYPFTFTQRNWSQGGITINVTNRQGDAYMANVLIIPKEIPGAGPGGR